VSEQTQLIRSAAAGDCAAFEALYKQYTKFKLILYFTKAFLYAPEEVEDVAQEVVIQMMKGLKNLKDPDAYRGSFADRNARGSFILRQ
jgi:DNA-directed RNA polymerase specialized sigma24 family protein